jgi:hypothetical protein
LPVARHIAAAINRRQPWPNSTLSEEDAAAHAADYAVAAAHGSVSGYDDRTVNNSGSAYDDDSLGVVGTPRDRDNESAGGNGGDK